MSETHEFGNDQRCLMMMMIFRGLFMKVRDSANVLALSFMYCYLIFSCFVVQV